MELSLDIGTASRLRQHFGGWQHSKLRHIWHDTSTGVLAERGIALAQDLRGWYACHVQRPGPAWAADKKWFVAPEPSPDAALATAARDDVTWDHARAAPVLPTVMLIGERWDVQAPTHAVNLCLLTGQWQTLTATSPCCRFMLEGADLDVAELVTVLAQTFPVTLPKAGLDEAAMAFAHGETPPPRRLGMPRLGAGLTVEQGFIEIVSHLTEVMVFWGEKVPQAGLADPSDEMCEPVHQMRVALRRLRSALRAFRDVMSCPALAALKPEFQLLGQKLGPPRDWDVFISETLGDVRAALPNEAALLPLRRAALRRRQEAYITLNAFLAEGRFSRLAVALACLTLQKPWRLEADDLLRESQRTALETFGCQILRRRYRHILTRGGPLLDEPAEKPSAVDLHNLRLQCKQLRYLAEFFAPLFASKAATRFIRRLARVQEKLGNLNDATVAAELMTSLPPVTRRAQGIVQGFMAGRMVDRRGELAPIWRRFRKQDEFW